MVLGETESVDNYGGFAPILLPMLIAEPELFFYYRNFFVKISDKTEDTKVQKALNMGNWGSIILTAVFLFSW